jgi:hypothetical protein
VSEESVPTIRDTPFGQCIGATILDITAVDTEDFLSGEPNHVYFHLSNGMTIFATMGVDGEGLMGFLDLSEDDDQLTK